MSRARTYRVETANGDYKVVCEKYRVSENGDISFFMPHENFPFASFAWGEWKRVNLMQKNTGEQDA